MNTNSSDRKRAVTDRGHNSQKPIPTGIRMSDLGYHIVIENREPYRLRPAQEKVTWDAEWFTASPETRRARRLTGAGWNSRSGQKRPAVPNAAAK